MIADLFAGIIKLVSGANPRWVGCNPEERQRIYFANHTSHLDAVVLWATLPMSLRIRTRPVAAQDYWTKSKMRFYLASKVFRAVLIEREKVSLKNNPLDLLLKALQQGDSLIIFPEGTRGNGRDIQPFKSGLYHLAKKMSDVEFVPVHIDNMNRILPKGEVLPVPLLSCVSFGESLRLADKESKSDFLERARLAIVDLKQS
ncbi:MAG: 1-acyl-sn-glycerol-3-phosphate acyltransferase [Verrucomicrobia bacterium]|nr:1-acyl-sn-glycerol-3-phosphate acyltransferase [Verrucomicrobiota bacterium]